MFRRALPALCVLAALAAAPAAAGADDTVAADPAAGQVTALDGTVVWVSGEFGAQVLMQRTADGVARVPGAPRAVAYRSVDLGRDASGRLVLTYLRCRSAAACAVRRDDLRGTRLSVRLAVPARCTPSTAPALWRTRAAYGVACRTVGGRHDAARSGLYVRTGAGAPRRLPFPREAARAGSLTVESVDLRGTRVAAVAADVYAYAYATSVTGRGTRAFLAAASEGDTDARTPGLALGTGGALWALTTASHADDPNTATVLRHAGACLEWEQLANAAGPGQAQGYRAVDLAVDGDVLHLAVPGVGIVTHAFAPGRPC